jgi:hypothetical protein
MSGTLVVGTGRCGTWWLTHLLRNAGVVAHHEVHYNMTRHGPVPDNEVEVSWLAAPYLHTHHGEIIHLIRHPLKVVASRAAWGSFEKQRHRHGDGQKGYDARVKGGWAIHHYPIIGWGKTPVERAARHWVAWMKLLVDIPNRLYLEGITSFDIEYYFGVVVPNLCKRPTNKSHNPDTLTWNDVRDVDGFIELAGELGYTVD